MEKLNDSVGGTCIICNVDKERGIYILTEFMCEECQNEIVKTDVSDEKYPFFINQMKPIFYKRSC